MYGANCPLSLSVQYFESPKRISSAFHTPDALFSVRATIRLEKSQSQSVNAKMKAHRILMTTMMIVVMIKQCNDDDEDNDSGCAKLNKMNLRTHGVSKNVLSIQIGILTSAVNISSNY